MNEIMQEDRQVVNFSRVAVSGIGNLHIVPGDQESLVIKAQQDVLPHIITEVKEGELIIRFKRTGWLPFMKPVGPLDYYLTVKKLDGISISGACSASGNRLCTDRMKIKLSGAGKIKMDLTAQALDTTISGAGKVTIAGQVDDQTLTISGAGVFTADELACKQCRVRISGAGKSTVNVNDALDIVISGSGKVLYRGEPTLSQRISGVGHVGRVPARSLPSDSGRKSIQVK